MQFTATIKGTNAGRSRTLNRQAVLGQIIAGDAMGRAELARGLGLSTQAVSNIIADLLADGLILEKGTRAGGRGLPTMLYGLNPKGGYAFGVEIRPDAVFTALVDLSGNPIATHRHPLPDPSPDRVAALVQGCRDKLLREARLSSDKVLGVGVVMPGPFGKTGLAGQSADLPGWDTTDPKALLSEALGLPVELSNDANASAMAERLGGVAGRLTSFAYLYFGAGLGLGVVQNGQLMTGAFGNAGEIGQIPIMTPDGPLPLERRLSRLSIQTHMGRAVEITELDRLFAARDPALMAWMDPARAALAQAVVLVENLFDPATIVLGGAMPEALLDDLIATTDLSPRSVSNRPDNPLPRLTRGRAGRLTATLGAASLILDQTFNPSPFSSSSFPSNPVER